MKIKKILSLLLGTVLVTSMAITSPTFAEEQNNSKLQLSPVEDNFKENSKDDELLISPLKTSYDSVRAVSRSALPAKYDLRKTNRVSSVKNQGQNGSCWTFATYGSMESYLKLFGTEYDFSEKHMRNMHGFDWGPNDGGNRDIAASYLARGTGPILEKDDPYDAYINVSPTNVKRAFDIDKVIYLPDVHNANETNVIKQAIMEYGGVYTTLSSQKYYEKKETKSYYNPGSGKADHAGTIVGWDDNFSKNLFQAKAPGDGAWIVKNSWGTNFMDGGYYYVSYYDGFCGKSNAVFIPQRKDPNAVISQYDDFGATRSVGYNMQGYIANVFTSEEDQTIYEAGLFTVAMNTKYKLYMVKDLKSTDDLTSNREEIGSGVIEYPGYYTLDTKQIKVKKGEKFAIVAYMDSSVSNYKYPMPIEMPVADYASKAKAQEGQSFVSSQGEKWTDLTKEVKNANACIKAIGTTGDVLPRDTVPEVDPDEVIEEPTSITVKEGSQGFISVKKKGKLHATVQPEKFNNDPVVFESLDKNVAVVKNDGTVYPVNVGNANILIKTVDGKITQRFNLLVAPEGIRVPDRKMIEVIGDNDYDPKTDPDNTEIPVIPPKPPIDNQELDPKVVRSLGVSVPSVTIKQGDKFNLDPKILTYPQTAIRNFDFNISNTDIIDIDSKSVITAKKIGRTKLDIKTKEGLQTSITIIVIPKEKGEITVEKFAPSKRRAGIFTVFIDAKEGDRGYSGPAKLTVKSGNRKLTRTIYFNSGHAQSKFHGGQFGVWRKDFEATITIRNHEETVKFGF
ncbi:MAG: lectin like domain-containing protein [Finegoldia magna]|uniref:lectin like domain-containing protein n=1 Tax=Finegoldia magna TaxID=1260 RepID=UPI00290981F0|nr:lectin like domain-containing protein [Finegoldia magna]MDU5223156.1 lectin like domain-containing protein [Finegoldia magna]